MSDALRDWPLALTTGSASGPLIGFENTSVVAPDGTRLRVVVGGKKNARRVVMLHGAPQFSYAWRRVMPLLAGDYRVIVPDCRGYGLSDLAASGRYDLPTLTADLAAVLDQTREQGESDEAILLAHDWGGPIAWAFTEQNPSRVRHLVATNAPHPAAYAREITKPSQMLRAWYIAAFQIPGIERVIEMRKAEPFLWMMKKSAPPGTFSDEDIDVYRACFARPCRPGAVLAYYRQAFENPIERIREVRAHKGLVETPVTIVWGEGDRAIAPSHPDATRPFCTRLEIRRLPSVSHWVPEEKPEELARAVRDGDAAG